MTQRIQWPAGSDWRQEVTLSGRVYRLQAAWNELGEFWSMDILTRTAEPIVMGIKIVLGVAMTARLADERLPPGVFVVVTNDPLGGRPGRDDFVASARLLYVPTV